MINQIQSETEDQYQQEIEAEASGVNPTEFSSTKEVSDKKKKVVSKSSPGKNVEKENRDLAKIMMSKKDKYLYHRIQHSNQKKSEASERLRQKKAKLQQRK